MRFVVAVRFMGGSEKVARQRSRWVPYRLLAQPMDLVAASALRVPYEQLSRGFRNSQKLLERELAIVVGEIERLDPAAADTAALLDRLIGQLSQLKTEVRNVGGVSRTPAPPRRNEGVRWCGLCGGC